MKTIFATLFLLLSTGCSALGVPGTADYEISTFENSRGEMVCCVAKVFNSKDYDKFTFTFEMDVDGNVKMTLDEAGVSASNPAMVMAENQAEIQKHMLNAITTMIPLMHIIPKVVK